MSTSIIAGLFVGVPLTEVAEWVTPVPPTITLYDRVTGKPQVTSLPKTIGINGKQIFPNDPTDTSPKGLSALQEYLGTRGLSIEGPGGVDISYISSDSDIPSDGYVGQWVEGDIELTDKYGNHVVIDLTSEVVQVAVLTTTANVEHALKAMNVSGKPKVYALSYLNC